ncbi:MAG: efflux RND transporter permease subunit, partial [Spirochaetota bacterium]
IGFNQKGKDRNIIKYISKKKDKKNNRVDNIEYKFESQFSLLNENINEILLSLFMSIFLEYAILAIQFKSFSKPILVMIMIPISICGMFFILLITNNSLNINTFMSIIVLIGLLVNNGIVLFYDYDNENAKDKEKIIDLTLNRLPAIFITQFSTIIALIPTFFSNNKIQISLSLNLIIGLIYSTFITILSLPLFYYYLKCKKVKA